MLARAMGGMGGWGSWRLFGRLACVDVGKYGRDSAYSAVNSSVFGLVWPRILCEDMIWVWVRGWRGVFSVFFLFCFLLISVLRLPFNCVFLHIFCFPSFLLLFPSSWLNSILTPFLALLARGYFLLLSSLRSVYLVPVVIVFPDSLRFPPVPFHVYEKHCVMWYLASGNCLPVFQGLRRVPDPSCSSEDIALYSTLA